MAGFDKIPTTSSQWLFPFFVSVVFINATFGSEMGLKEYCESDSFTADCGPEAVIVMQMARYGRMRAGRCITTNYGRMDCAADVLGLMDKRCSGQSKCDVIVSTLVPEHMQPCPKDLRSYLEANYTCQAVKTGSPNLCRSSNHVRVTGISGYVSSHVASTQSLGSLDCPWLLEAEPGQTLRITLWDFAWSGNSEYDTICHVYAILKETAVSNSETICAGSQRQNHVYTSATNLVEARLVVKPEGVKEQGRYLLHYQALGCGDPSPPKHGWIQREGNEVEMGCNLSEDSWSLKCEGNKWIGKIYNCTAGEAGTMSGNSSVIRFTSGLSILVIIMIAVAIGVIILLFGMIFLRRQLRSRQQEEVVNQGTYDAYAPPPLPAPNMVSQHSKSREILDPYQSAENAYSRTWNMRQHSGCNVPGSDPNAYHGSRYVEHIYESPKFDRKDFQYEDEGQAATSAQYFELDPGAVSTGCPSYQFSNNAPPKRYNTCTKNHCGSL